jgi:hypothetical protein
MSINEEAHSAAVWAISVNADGRGFATGSADKVVKFWEFTVFTFLHCISICLFSLCVIYIIGY